MAFTLNPTAQGTRVELMHSQLPSSELDGHTDGWTHFLPRLRIVAAGGDAGDDDWVPIDDGAQPDTHNREGAHHDPDIRFDHP